MEASDQGRAFSLVSKDPVSSHWVVNGRYMSFSDYRFALKARLNLLPTKTVVKRIGRPINNVNCSRCNQAPETLAHILNACSPNAGLMRERHNSILKRLVKAVPQSAGNKFVEQKVLNSPYDLRPDLVVLNDEANSATIVDVTIPFEASPLAFTTAGEEKLRKYAPLVEWLTEKGYKTSSFAFIVGALGAWDPDNMHALGALSIGRNYSKLFKKLCVLDAIHGSHNIWRQKNSSPITSC